ncbi:MAG: PP2C family protein-serine/threonine phosphatase [Phycisphaerales bacterium]|nr:PP2C family protein-serine/threonine phosphatase [Phycisphaerales bacterium]
MTDIRQSTPRSDSITADWQARLAHAVETVRGLSRQTDPQAMVHHYRDRIRQTMIIDGSVSLSRRGLRTPQVRITRSSRWQEDINPWKQKDRLPVIDGGLLGELIWSDLPRIIERLDVPLDDPAADYLAGYRSLLALPLFDGGTAQNMVVLLRREEAAFAPEDLPNQVMTSNLFGRATHNLVLSGELRTAYEEVDSELRVIADIQRSLLPQQLPEIPTMQLAAHYQTARRAGGDYYDFFKLPDGKWGLLLADVAGHGTPAAVLMAVTHSLAHGLCEREQTPAGMLRHLNTSLHERYTGRSGAFVTGLYGVYEPRSRRFTYAVAGHPPPRVKRCADGSVFWLDAVGGLPLGIVDDEAYPEYTQQLEPGDQIIFYTDGITEAMNAAGELFGPDRLDAVLENCHIHATDIIQRLLDAVDAFADGHAPDDDRTVLVAKIK